MTSLIQFISKYLDEYKRLEKAEVASDAMLATLYRSFPNEYPEYSGLDPYVLNGKGSVAVKDSEGQIISVDALEKAFDGYLNSNPMYRNINFSHSNQQVGTCLPVFKSASGFFIKSGVVGNALHIVADLNNKNRFYNTIMKMIDMGLIKDYSIGGRILNNGIQTVIDKSGNKLEVVKALEIFEVTVCSKGVNPDSHFSLLKGSKDIGSTLAFLKELNRNINLNF